MIELSELNDSTEDLPRPGSALYNLTIADESKREKTLKKWNKMNKYLIKPLYKVGILPILGFGGIFLILTTKGRITGKKRKTPLEYHWIDGVITVFSARGKISGWMKNLVANPNEVAVRHGFHRFEPRVDIIEDDGEKLRIVKWYVGKHGRSSKMLFGWNPKSDDPETTNLIKLTNLLSIVRLHKK